jgi:magnesium transporter
MIKFYSRTVKDKQLKELKKFKVGSWAKVVSPTEEEIRFLVDDLKIEEGHIKDALDPYEVPRFELEGDDVYVFTRIPKKSDGTYITVPILIVICHKGLVTVSKQENDLLTRLIEGKDEVLTTQKIKLFIQLMAESNRLYNLALTNISRKIYDVSVRLERIKNRHIIDMVMYEQILNNFLNALIRTNNILNTLLSGKTLKLFKSDTELIEDLFLFNGQLVELTKNSLQTVKNIRDAHNTIMSNNLNRTVKLFTSLTVILTIPTIIASFFGMNVTLPLMDHPLAFWAIFGFALMVSGFLIYIFSKNDWL